MKHPVSAAITATVISGWAFAFAFIPLAGLALAATFPGADGGTMFLQGLGFMSATLFLALPSAFILFIVGALVPAALLYFALERFGAANEITAALASAAACGFACHQVFSSWPYFAVAGALAGGVAGVAYRREMVRWLKPRPAPPS